MSSAENCPAAPRKRKWLRRVIRLAMMLLIPVAILAALEGGLRLFGYGYQTNFLSIWPPGECLLFTAKEPTHCLSSSI